MEALCRTLMMFCLFVLCSIVLFSHLLQNRSLNLRENLDVEDVKSFIDKLDQKVTVHGQQMEEETYIQNPRRPKVQKSSTERGGQKQDQPVDKLFAYYVLTPQCLREELLKKGALGDGTLLDVYVNCYSSLCYDDLKPHITYILNTSTTWTSGRNLLYNYVKWTKRKYKYHIFLDDDVALFYTEHIINYAKENGNVKVDDAYLLRMYESDPAGLSDAFDEVREGKTAWRKFEEDLLEESPAFATTNLFKFHGFESRTVQLKHWERMCPVGSKMPWITTTFFIDTLFIAYHEDALPLLFPYSEIYESKNWWVSAVIQCFRARELLHKQGMCNYRVSVMNRLHRQYPKGAIPKDIIPRYLKKEAPELKRVMDHRFLDYTPFRKWQHYENMFFGDPDVCTGPMKFPVSKYYKVDEERRKGS